jgi:hypothetical protein
MRKYQQVEGYPSEEPRKLYLFYSVDVLLVRHSAGDPYKLGLYEQAGSSENIDMLLHMQRDDGR